MLGCDIDHVVRSFIGDDQIWNIKGLSIDIAVYGACKELAKLIHVHIKSVKHRFIKIGACPAVIVVLG